MTSLQTGGPNQDQVAYWNSEAGDLWVNVQPRFDRLFAGITSAILDAANPAEGETVLADRIEKQVSGKVSAS